MNSVNKVIIVWNITKLTEWKITDKNRSVVNFTVATNRYWKDSDGIKQSDSEYHNLVAYWQVADIISEHCIKWSKVYIEGRLKTREWDDAKTGEKKWKTEIIVEEVMSLTKELENVE